MDELDFEIKKVLKSEIDLPCEYTKMISYTLKNKNNIKKNRFETKIISNVNRWLGNYFRNYWGLFC